MKLRSATIVVALALATCTSAIFGSDQNTLGSSKAHIEANIQ
jgi:hypothetical protein